MRYVLLLLLSLALMGIVGCQGDTRSTDPAAESSRAAIREVSPSEAQKEVSKAYSQFVDVREPAEYRAGHASRSRNIPLSTLADNLDMIERNEPVYLICQTSNRSREAAKTLASAGFKQVVVITGGTVAWQADGLPME
ncbi:MAG: rhodanese-like domain-containing protein [Acidobacteriota bacterium]